MADIAIDISDLLAAAGVGSVTPPLVSIFCGRYGANPDDAIMVRPLPGSSPMQAMGPSLTAPVFERPEAQILLRNPDWVTHQTKIEEVKAALHHYQGVIDGRHYYIELTYEPIYLGVDENNRHQSSLVFSAVRRRV